MERARTIAQVCADDDLIDLIDEHDAVLLHRLDGLPLHLRAPAVACTGLSTSLPDQMGNNTATVEAIFTAK